VAVPRLLAVAFALFALLSTSQPLHAGVTAGSTEVMVLGGTQNDGAQLSWFGVQLLPHPGLEESSYFIGATVGHNLTPHVAAELDVGYAPRLGESHEAAVTTLTADLLYHFNPNGPVVFYAALGAGAALFDSADHGVPNDTTGTVAAAIGIKAYLDQRWLLRLDFRYYYAPSPFTDQNLMHRWAIGVGVRF